jgi:cellulose synthase/poly-beta-1,6-N-acetylglucosamine synthase-like glycosyltransferase
MLISLTVTAVVVLGVLAIFYVVVGNTVQVMMIPAAARFLWRHQRRHTRRARALATESESGPLVSIIMPAYNESLTIIHSVRALLALDYEFAEIVVVNDGSTDETLPLLQRTFQLLPAPLAFEQPLVTQPVRGVYRSVVESSLVVIDKENGRGKADAANAGINVASGTLVLVIDADTILDPEALSRVVLPFLEDPTTIAVGANVAIANGCRVQNGRITDVFLPRSWLARFQVIEYMRSFLLTRLTWASFNGVVIISGAFGLFRRETVIEVGGYDPTAIGEDMDLTIRLQRHCRAHGLPFRITFDPNALAWTQAPEDWQSLKSQRCRWRRGLLQVLWRSRRMLGNPRYGIVGLGVLPYLAIFEGLSPLLEVAGYVIITLAAVAGPLDWPYWRLLVCASVLFGMTATLLSVLMSDVVTRRYLRGRDLVLLVIVALLENCGYRQLNAWWSCVGTVQALTGKSGWGVMKRRAFEGAP